MPYIHAYTDTNMPSIAYLLLRTYTPTESAVYSVYLSVYICAKTAVCQNSQGQNGGTKPVTPKRADPICRY